MNRCAYACVLVFILFWADTFYYNVLAVIINLKAEARAPMCVYMCGCVWIIRQLERNNRYSHPLCRKLQVREINTNASPLVFTVHPSKLVLFL